MVGFMALLAGKTNSALYEGSSSPAGEVIVVRRVTEIVSRRWNGVAINMRRTAKKGAVGLSTRGKKGMKSENPLVGLLLKQGFLLVKKGGLCFLDPLHLEGDFSKRWLFDQRWHFLFFWECR